MSSYVWNGLSDDWTVAGDWTPVGVPGTADTAAITTAGTYTVGIAAGETIAVGSATLDAAGATLEVDGQLSASGSLELDAGTLVLTGTIANTTIVDNGGTFAPNLGTFSNVTYDGTLDLGDSGILQIANGLTVHGVNGTGAGVINVTGAQAATLVFTDTETLDNVTLNIGNDTGFDMTVSNGDTLTLGTGVVVNSVGLNGLDIEGGVVVSEGTINAGVAGGQAKIGATSFVNAGALNVTGGQTLVVNAATFANTGALVIDSTSELDFQGTVIAATQASGGSVDIEGTLNANGATIDLGATSAFANTTLGGTLENATIVSDGGIITYNLGTLVAATVDGTLDLGTNGIVTILGGLTVNGANGTGAGVIDVTGAGAATLVFGDTETLDNVTLNIGNDTGFDMTVSNGDTLTLGTGVVVNSVGLNGLDIEGGVVVSEGTINAGVAGGQAKIGATSFVNAGALNVTGGQTLVVNAATFANTGALVIDSTSELDFQGTVIAATQASGGSVDIEGTLNANGATIDLGATSAFANTTLGGTLENATIVSDGGIITYNLGTLVAATVDGTLDLGTNGIVTILGGLTVNGANGTGAGVIDVTGAGAATLVFGDTETLDNVTLNIGNDTGFDMTVSNGDTLTLGTDVVVNSVGLNGLDIEGGVVVSEGTINAGVAGGQAKIGATSFVNAGALNVTGGQTLLINAATFANTGLVEVGAGSSLDITPAVSGTGRVVVGTRGVVTFGDAVGSGQDITLHGTQVDLVLDQPSSVAAKIHGFVSSDRIDLVGVTTLTSLVKTVGATAVVTDGGPSITLNFVKAVAGQAYGLVSDGQGGSDLITGRVINGAAGGHATLNAGIGNAIITAHGFGNTITASTCDAVINAGSGGAKVSVGPGNAVVNLSGTLNRVTAGNGSDIVDGHTSISAISLGNGNDQVQLTGALDAVVVGTGTDTINVTGSLDAVKVGSGVDTITLVGNTDLVSLTGGAASLSLTGAKDAVFLGSGTATIADAGSSLSVVAAKGVGHAIVTGVASDPSFVLDLTGGVGGYGTAAQAYAALTSDGNGGSLLALGATGSVDFAGVTTGQLSAKNFAVIHTAHV